MNTVISSAGYQERSVELLRLVLDGATYEDAAQQYGLSRTAVERRVKLIAAQLTTEVGVDGLQKEGTAFVSRLRRHRGTILLALEGFHPTESAPERSARVLSDSDIRLGAVRIKSRASRTWHDLSLYHLLFATGLRPLEVARLTVGDYLRDDGEVRRESELRASAAIGGRARPLFFISSRLDEALDAYLAERLAAGHGLGQPGYFRGLDPASRLFLSASGQAYPILPAEEPDARRHVCRALLEIYRRLFRQAGIEGLSTQSARMTLTACMYARGADEDQVGLVLGIADRSGVRQLLPRPKPELAELMKDLL